MKNKAVAFTGPSNSGKTTLIVKISHELTKNNKVCIIKNDPKDKAVFDTEGKDSWKFAQTGADVIVSSPKKTTYLSNEQKSIEQMCEIFGEFDYLLVEGLKEIDLPRIAIFRESIDENYFPYIQAIALDEKLKDKRQSIPKNIEIIDLNDIQSIILWIEKNSKKVK